MPALFNYIGKIMANPAAQSPGVLRKLADALIGAGTNDPTITARVSDSPDYQLYLRDAKEGQQQPLTYDQWAQQRFQAAQQREAQQQAAPQPDFNFNK